MKKEDYLIPGLKFKSPYSGEIFIISNNPRINEMSTNDIRINDLMKEDDIGGMYSPYIYYNGRWAEIISSEPNFPIFN